MVAAPAALVVVLETTVVVPIAIPSTRGSSSLAESVPPPVKTATLLPGDTKPATRPVSDRLTEMAMSPSGMVRADESPPAAANLPAMICSLG